jgi:hypothetical protein
MKKTTTFAVAAALVIGAALTGCASRDPKPMAASSMMNRVMLDFQGAAGNATALPDWVSVYAETGSDLEVQKLSTYKSFYCFVGTSEGPDRDFATTWARSVNGPEAVASTMSTRIEAVTHASRNGDPSATERAIDQEIVNNLSATYSGVRPVANYWVQWRVYDPDNKKEVRSENYTAYTLYTSDKKQFENQVAQTIAQALATHKELSAQERQIYSNLINRILEQGLDVE